MELSVVVPVYRSAPNAVEHLPNIIDALRRKYREFEVLFIIDYHEINTDINTFLSACKNYKEIQVYFLNRNFGQHFATLCGYYAAKGDFIACIDEDMTKYIAEVCHHPEYRNYDVFYFYYNKNDMYQSNVRRFFSNSYKNIINKVVNLKRHSTYRIISKSLRDKILTDKHIFWNLDVMIFNNTNNIGSAALFIPDINDKHSVYNYKKLSLIAFEIAYEHNTLLMNTLFAGLCSLFFYLVTDNRFYSILLFVFTLLISTIFFKLIKHKSHSTVIKILNAFK